MFLYPDFMNFPEPTMTELMNFVAAEIPAMWCEIGRGLGVKEGELKAVQAQYASMPKGPQRCFQEVLTLWHDGATSEYSWKHLVEVLQSPAVKQHRLVKTLYEKLAKNISSR